MFDFAAKWPDGLGYDAFLETYGTAEHRRRWAEVHALVRLSAEQQSLLAGFTREMHVICLAGAWCGDCVNQCPIFDCFQRANEQIVVRYFDRDEHDDLQQELTICGGNRVPVLVFLSEDNFEIGRYGDRTLSKYRQMASDRVGASCPTGLAQGQDMLQAVTQDWLNEFERGQWLLRLSSRLRQKHGD